MSNPLIKYYSNQAGSGIVYFDGVKNQRGHGFINNIFKPGIKYLARKLLGTTLDFGQDILDGNNIKESAKRRFESSARDIGQDIIKRGRKYLATGEGLLNKKRKYKKKRKITLIKKNKTIKGKKKSRKLHTKKRKKKNKFSRKIKKKTKSSKKKRSKGEFNFLK